jgi:molybdenum cofactor cytidylyltransferase
MDAYNPPAGRDIVVPIWQGQSGNPKLWGRRYFNEIMSLQGDSGAARLLSNYRDHVAECPAPSDAVLRDFDTQAALDQLGGSA